MRQSLSYNVFMNDKEIVYKFKAGVQKIVPEAEIYFYGSRVKKKHHMDSDFDVLVVINRISPKIREKIYRVAWEIGFAHEVVIAPIICLHDEFARSRKSIFFTAVKREGVRL